MTKSSRAKKATEVLESARDMAEKLAGSDEPNKCKAKVYTTLAIAYQSQRYSENAVNYAKKALEFGGLDEVIKKKEKEKLQEILSSNLTNN